MILGSIRTKIDNDYSEMSRNGSFNQTQDGFTELESANNISDIKLGFQKLKEIMDYNNKKFRPVQNSENGELSDETIFAYQQEGNILTSTYSGGKVIKGHLIGIVDEHGCIEISYHQINAEGCLKTGICSSKPEVMSNGKIRLYEKWNGLPEIKPKENQYWKKCRPNLLLLRKNSIFISCFYKINFFVNSF